MGLQPVAESTTTQSLSAIGRARFPFALSPLAIGPVTVPNRIVRTGHGTGIGAGTMSPSLIDYHVERAKGGVGLTILEAMAVGSSAYPFLVSGADGLIEGYRALMKGVAPYGMKAGNLELTSSLPFAEPDAPIVSVETMDTAINVGEVYAKLVRDMREGTRQTPGLDHALRNSRVIDAVMRAAETGQRQKLAA